MTWPTDVLTTIEPTLPSAAATRAMVFTSPICAASPTTLVPRMPMVATGVVTTMPPGLFAATAPLTKTKVP